MKHWGSTCPERILFLRFHSGQYQFKVPFVIYADFKAILQSSKEETDSDPLSFYMTEINRYVPSGLCTYTIFAYGEVENLLRIYWGKDCVEVISEEAKRLYHMFFPKLMEPLMLEQWKEFGRVAKCHICLECFELWDTIFRDHCHYTGKYRGATHRKCNLQY